MDVVPVEQQVGVAVEVRVRRDDAEGADPGGAEVTDEGARSDELEGRLGTAVGQLGLLRTGRAAQEPERQDARDNASRPTPGRLDRRRPYQITILPARVKDQPPSFGAPGSFTNHCT